MYITQFLRNRSTELKFCRKFLALTRKCQIFFIYFHCVRSCLAWSCLCVKLFSHIYVIGTVEIIVVPRLIKMVGNHMFKRANKPFEELQNKCLSLFFIRMVHPLNSTYLYYELFFFSFQYSFNNFWKV